MDRIGQCEWCGIVDHHLEAGLCPCCRAKAIDWPPPQQESVPLGAEADVRHALVYATPALRLAVLGPSKR